MEKKKGMGRRELLKGALAAGVTGMAEVITGESVAQDKPAPDADPMAADLAGADRLAGRDYTEADRALMVRRAKATRESLKAVRGTSPDGGGEPATHFEPRLPGVKYPSGKGSFRLSSGKTPAYTGTPESLAFASATDLSRLLQARKITSTELTKMYLERLKTYAPRLLCVVTLLEESALRQAAWADAELRQGRSRSLLHGIPYGAKDLLAVKGVPTTWGAKPYAERTFDTDATVIERLNAAGAVLLAKLSMGELALGDVWFGGMTRNPWNPRQGSSGSSAGSGSATAAGLVGFAIGTETLGSIVSPSVRNGTTGLRPTYGRVPRTGAMALSWTMDKIGPMARGVEDCALILNAIYGPDGKDASVADVPFRWNPSVKLSGLRVGIDTAAFEAVEKENNEARRKVYQDVQKTLKDLGISLIPTKLPELTKSYQALPEIIIDAEGAASFTNLNLTGGLAKLARQTEDAWPNTFRLGSTIPATDYINALRLRRHLQDEIAKVFDTVDCYVTVPLGGPTIYYTNLTGQPTLVTRCGLIGNVPQSIEFVGGLYREDAILRVGLAYEQATDHHTKWPDTTKIPPLS